MGLTVEKWEKKYTEITRGRGVRMNEGEKKREQEAEEMTAREERFKDFTA